MNNMDDIIFDKRNKAYGAYALRKAYNRVVGISILVCSITFIVIILGIFLRYLLLSETIYSMRGYAGGKGDTSLVVQYNENSGPPPQSIPQDERNTIPVVVDSSKITKQTTTTLFNDNPGDTTGKGNGSSNGNGNGGGDGQIYLFAEQPPSYPGGEKERMSFLQRNIMYPAAARKNKIQGSVYVSFVVERNGSLSNIKILKGIGSGCDEEAVRVLKLMPAWIPGVQNGNTVRVQVIIPLTFVLSAKT
ncbi:MAG: energy transducer TonB [Bacteroidota bacterium]